MSDRMTALKKVDAADFAVKELTLFLDTHPGNAEAAQLLRQYHEQYRQAVAAYEAVFGPLTIDGACTTGRTDWCWVKGPWPWEYVRGE